MAVEVKTTCRPKDIDEHIQRLEKVHQSVSTYSTGAKKLYGAMAALRYEADADLYAKRKGMFVLQIKESLFAISNEQEFSPKAY